MNRKPILIIVITIIVMLIAAFFKKCKSDGRKEELNRFPVTETWAIFDREAKAIGSFGTFYYFFDKNNNKIEFKVSQYFDGLEIGDTVWIRYSRENSANAEVINPYYMQKYKLDTFEK